MTPRRQHVIDEIDRVARELRDRVAQLDIERSHVATGGGLKRAMRLVERFEVAAVTVQVDKEQL